MKKIISIILCLFLCACSSSNTATVSDKKNENTPEPTLEPTMEPTPVATEEVTVDVVPEFDWYGTFSQYNLSDEDIAWMQEVMNNVGIYEVDLLPNNYSDCSVGLCAFRSSFIDSKNLQLNFTTEEGKLFYVTIAGIPSTKSEVYINWRGQVKFKDKSTTKECDLYYDIEGGYLHYYNIEDNTIVAYDEKPQK